MIENIKYIVISNNHLTEYLEAAKQMRIIEDKEGNGYIQLIFTQPVCEEENDEDEEEYLNKKIEAHPEPTCLSKTQILNGLKCGR